MTAPGPDPCAPARQNIRAGLIDLGSGLAALICLASALPVRLPAASRTSAGSSRSCSRRSSSPRRRRSGPGPTRGAAATGWPSRRRMATTFVPGWLLMLGAAAGKAAASRRTWRHTLARGGGVAVAGCRASRGACRHGDAALRARLGGPRRRDRRGPARLAHGYGASLRAPRRDGHVARRVPVPAARLDWFTVQRGNGDFTKHALAFIPPGSASGSAGRSISSGRASPT
jgi:hypothetical protein